jgi:hypothetical protein
LKNKAMHFSKFIFLTLLISLFSSACTEKTGDSACNSTFDQSALFSNIADKIILPGYAKLQTSVNELVFAQEAFQNTPDLSTLSNLRSTWHTAYLNWQDVAPYELGPAEEVFLRNSLNNFPSNIDSIEQHIQSGSYNFDQPDAYDKGFPALDYLLYGLAPTEQEILDRYLNPTDGSKYQHYLKALVLDIQSRVNHTYTSWQNGYADAFIANTGTAAGSSLSLLVNQLNQHYEAIKRDKIGIPSGVLTLGIPNPQTVEARFSGYSIELALRALRASEQLYLGKGIDGTNGVGFDDYLEAINAKKNGNSLDAEIHMQYTQAIATLEALPGPLSTAVVDNQSAVEQVYNEITRQLVNTKTDMPSVLCVSITYIDNPSDSD